MRRRLPPPTAFSPMNTRRRTTSMNGRAYTAVARRRDPTTISPRRRSEPPVPYGYSSRPQMMNNYGGTMPMQTNYGYSGYDAYPAHHTTNMVTYSGYNSQPHYGYSDYDYYGQTHHGYSGYDSYPNDGYSKDYWHRRRRRTPVDWCIVRSPSSSRDGSFMNCIQCQRMFGYASCQSARDCNTAAGCSYTTPSSFGRDDLAETGFVPKQFVPPLRVTFSEIKSDDIDPDPITGICPPTNAAQASLVRELNKTMSFKPDLFLVLTRQDTLAQAGQKQAGQKQAQTVNGGNDPLAGVVNGVRAMGPDFSCCALLAALLALSACKFSTPTSDS